MAQCKWHNVNGTIWHIFHPTSLTPLGYVLTVTSRSLPPLHHLGMSYNTIWVCPSSYLSTSLTTLSLPPLQHHLGMSLSPLQHHLVMSLPPLQHHLGMSLAPLQHHLGMSLLPLQHHLGMSQGTSNSGHSKRGQPLTKFLYLTTSEQWTI